MFLKVVSLECEDMFDHVLDLIIRSEYIVPERYRQCFDVPNFPLNIHGEGPRLRDHLRAMLKVLFTIYHVRPELQQYLPIIKDQENRMFFTFAIMWHDIGKGIIEPIIIEENGQFLSVYPDHERVSYELLCRHPEFAAEMSNRDILLDVVRWHGEVYKLGAAPVSQDAFMSFIRTIGIEDRVESVLPLLLSFCLIDVYGTKRPDPWEYRVVNVANAYRDYLANNGSR